ncbi:MAG: hypothetical protein ACE5FD_03585 [Anaerolineae bacterium]
MENANEKTMYVKLEDGVTAPKRWVRIDTDEKRVYANIVTRRDRHSPRYAHTWTLDFNDVGDDELLDLASKTVVIAFQREWRELSTDNARMEYTPPSVRELLDRERKTTVKDPLATIKKELDGLNNKAKMAKLKEMGIL